MTIKKKQPQGINPVTVEETVWFYPVKGKLQFVVKVGNKCHMFDLSLRKIKKYVTK